MQCVYIVWRFLGYFETPLYVGKSSEKQGFHPDMGVSKRCYRNYCKYLYPKFGIYLGYNEHKTLLY